MADSSLVNEILAFWLADACAGPEKARARCKLWFGRDEGFDREIEARFGTCPERARNGEFDAWSDDPKAAAARILALDQFPRNLFRGDARAFAYDPAAQAAALAMTEREHDRALPPLLAVFVYLPFEHAEERSLQDRAVRCFEALEARVEPQWDALFRGFTDYAYRHRAVIERFGRFPHRNAALGRSSSPEEERYLAGGGERFGASR